MTDQWQKAREAAESAMHESARASSIEGGVVAALLDAALSAFSAGGWELTKAVPSEEMKKAGSQEWGLIWSTDDDGMNGCLDYDGCEKVYTAMITAALKERT